MNSGGGSSLHGLPKVSNRCTAPFGLNLTCGFFISVGMESFVEGNASPISAKGLG